VAGFKPTSDRRSVSREGGFEILELNSGHSPFQHPQAAGGAVGEVDVPGGMGLEGKESLAFRVGLERATVGYRDDHRFFGFEIDDSHPGPERQEAVGGGQLQHVIQLPGGSGPTVKDGAVPGSYSFFLPHHPPAR